VKRAEILRVLMHENGKMRPVETTAGTGRGLSTMM
jgi:hypothetical protein